MNDYIELYKNLLDLFAKELLKDSLPEQYAYGRDSYRAVSCAFRFYERKGDEQISKTISRSFTKPNGTYAY